MAGSKVSSEELEAVLGTAVTRSLPPALLRRLNTWLAANLRNDQSFRPANPLLIDAGKQR